MPAQGFVHLGGGFVHRDAVVSATLVAEGEDRGAADAAVRQGAGHERRRLGLRCGGRIGRLPWWTTRVIERCAEGGDVTLRVCDDVLGARSFDERAVHEVGVFVVDDGAADLDDAVRVFRRCCFFCRFEFFAERLPVLDEALPLGCPFPRPFQLFENAGEFSARSMRTGTASTRTINGDSS
jgi:hypothetical protein